uniref:Uncharacterized protein n=1 Tax=Podarcis muralis TaxID=64176 RepID=A0A670KEH0_PODMU
MGLSRVSSSTRIQKHPFFAKGPLCPKDANLILPFSQQVDIEQLDPRGRTPLHLATTLGHLECARVLLRHGADVGKENRSGWTVQDWRYVLKPSCFHEQSGV